MVGTNSNTLSLTQEGLNEVQSEFAVLAAALGAPLPKDFVYTADAGVKLSGMLADALVDAQKVLDAGVADGSIVQLGPVYDTDRSILAKQISKNSGGTIDFFTAIGVIKDADKNIVILDKVVGQMAQSKPAEVKVDPVIVSSTNTGHTETKTVPAVEIPADVRAAVMRTEQALAGIVETLNAEDPSPNLPAPGNIDGIFDDQSFKSYEQTLAHMKKAAGIEGKFPGSEYSVELGNELERLIKIDIGAKLAVALAKPSYHVKYLGGHDDAVKKVSDLKVSLEAVPDLFKDLDMLHAKGALKAVVMKDVTVSTAPKSDVVAPKSDVVAPKSDVVVPKSDAVAPKSDGEKKSLTPNEKIVLNAAVGFAEEALFRISGKLDGLTGQFGGIAKNLAGSLVTPLTKEDLQDKDANGVSIFGENSQDLMAKSIMLMKTLDGQKNPDGLYTADIGKQLKLSLLTKDDFSMVRDALGVQKLSAAEAKALVFAEAPKVPGKLADDATDTEKTAHAESVVKFAQLHEEFTKSQEKIKEVNQLFNSLNVLKENNLLNDAKAKSTTKMNMIVDGLAGALDNFAPGFKDGLKDFFMNSDFGKMIAGIMSMFGINVNRLWGDTDDASALKNAAGVVGDGFETAFDKIAKDEGLDPKLDFDKIMEKAKVDFQDKMNDFIPRNAMKLILGSTDAKQIESALNDAMDRAAKAGNMAEAKQIFVDRLAEIGESYKNGTDINLSDRSQDIISTIDKISTERPDLAVSPKASYVATQPAVDSSAINAGDVRVELEFNRNTKDFAQDPLRLSGGRVAAIQEVLHDNAGLLSLSAINPDFMHKEGDDSAFTDTMTKETSGILEEVWIRANVHALTEAGTEITQDALNSIGKENLSSENMGVILTYMHDKDVPQADVDAFSKNMFMLDKDFTSVDGSMQSVSVLDQSLLWDQLSASLAQWSPAQVVSADVGAVAKGDDPLRDRYMEFNKGNMPCDAPLFYKEEGSDSVFALIRVKTDGPMDNDPSNDTFKVLELEDYLKTRELDNPDHKAALLDNYNWKNPTTEGIESVINNVFCLEARPQVDTPDVKNDNRVVTRAFNTSAEVHKTPESFRDLRILTVDQAEFLLEKLDLANDRPDLMERAANNHEHPLNAFFGDAIGLQDGYSPFVFLDLEAHGFHNSDFDVVVAMRSGANIEFRYIDYDTDFIKPLSEQKAGGAADMAESIAPAQGARRMDDLLRVVERKPGGIMLQGAVGGYAHMSAIVPNGQDKLGLTNGLKAVYGSHMTTYANQSAYASGVTARHNESSRYENQRTSIRNSNSSVFNHKSGGDAGRDNVVKIDTGASDNDRNILESKRDIGDGNSYDPSVLDNDNADQDIALQTSAVKVAVAV